ncbi:SET and MYND domain-containing protein 4-like [Ochlerotatus camptorhynchus]|uniref:SET and MYND domain-containing protein 4-like n=1 Tax=Ochlerotatus camptorhynchus TaxID=644619 RepID=UPI0031D0B576
MEICEDTGFFHEDYEKFRSAISASEFHKFSLLENDEQRVLFVHEIIEDRFGGILWKPVRGTGIGKDFAKALESKVLGNMEFQCKRWQDALQCYNDAFLLLPSENDAEKAVILANRSAVLFHLNKYDLALRDIEYSIQLNYPENMRYKLMERKARCYLEMADLPSSLECYRETFAALHQSSLSEDQRYARMNEMQMIIDRLDAQITNREKFIQPVNNTVAELFVPYVDNSLYIDYTESEGRFARTKHNLAPNCVLLKESPHASVAMNNCSSTHCDRCCGRVEVLFGCPDCVDVVYCSEACQKQAYSGYHRFECGFLPFLRNSGANVVCMLSLRIASQKSEDYFYKLRDELDKLKSDFVDSLPFDDYRKVYNYVTHAKHRTAEDYLKWTLMAALLHTILVLAGFCKSKSLDGFLGKILLHNLQIVTYNSHEISELHRRKSQDPGYSVCIGAGLYPTLVLFNHSCDPGITRYFVNNAVYVRTIKNIPAGSVVAENYGQLYTRAARVERRKLLAENYKFDCNCQACEEYWLTVSAMNPMKVQFKCTAIEGCHNGLMFKKNSLESEMICSKCGGSTDVDTSFDLLKKANVSKRYKDATRLYAQGKYEKALTIYAAIIISLDEILVPPYMEYHLCQQGIRRCTLELGNRYIDRKCAL